MVNVLDEEQLAAPIAEEAGTEGTEGQHHDRQCDGPRLSGVVIIDVLRTGRLGFGRR